MLQGEMIVGQILDCRIERGVSEITVPSRESNAHSLQNMILSQELSVIIPCFYAIF
jgi:hypothetical protein